MLSYEKIMAETVFVAKMTGWRRVGTRAEIGYLADEESCRDFDAVCSEGQPEHLRPFYEAYEANLESPNHIFFLKEFYDEWIKTQ